MVGRAFGCGCCGIAATRDLSMTQLRLLATWPAEELGLAGGRASGLLDILPPRDRARLSALAAAVVRRRPVLPA